MRHTKPELQQLTTDGHQTSQTMTNRGCLVLLYFFCRLTIASHRQVHPPVHLGLEHDRHPLTCSSPKRALGPNPLTEASGDRYQRSPIALTHQRPALLPEVNPSPDRRVTRRAQNRPTASVQGHRIAVLPSSLYCCEQSPTPPEALRGGKLGFLILHLSDKISTSNLNMSRLN